MQSYRFKCRRGYSLQVESMSRTLTASTAIYLSLIHLAKAFAMSMHLEWEGAQQQHNLALQTKSCCEAFASRCQPAARDPVAVPSRLRHDAVHSGELPRASKQ